jgi:hypothetical protein
VLGEFKSVSKGELTCISRSILLTELPPQLHIRYPNGSTCFPAIRYADGSVKYIKGTAALEVAHDVFLAALDEGQTDIPDNPEWVHGGSYELAETFSNTEIIELLDQDIQIDQLTNEHGCISPCVQGIFINDIILICCTPPTMPN